MLGSVEVVPGDAVIKTCVCVVVFWFGVCDFFSGSAEEVRAPSL